MQQTDDRHFTCIRRKLLQIIPAKGRQLKVGCIGKLLYALIQPTGFAILPIPKNQLSVSQPRHDTLAHNQHRLYFALSDVQLLPDYNQIKRELL
jgi:hypothetical protein